MKVVRLRAPGGADNLTVLEEARPVPGPGQVLVRIRANALNLHDAMVVEGTIPAADGVVPLSDGAGEVVAVGEGVGAFKVGDAVVSTFYPDWLAGELTEATRRDVPGETIDGYAREFACRPAHAFTLAPPGYTPVQAATLTCTGVTAWRALVVEGRVRPGDTVLVQGTGGVSIFALQFARLAGARVIATSSSDAKLERLRGLGADAVIDRRAEPDWGRAVRALTDGRGVDHVVDVGGPSTLAQSIGACRIGGHIAMVGLLGGFTAELSVPAIFSNRIRISGISIGSRSDQEDMIRAITVGGLQPVVDRTFALTELGAALEHLASGRHVGKVCLEL